MSVLELYCSLFISLCAGFSDRVRSNHNVEKAREDVWREEAEAIKVLQKRVKKVNGAVAKPSQPFKAGRVHLLQLVQIRRVHQTKRAEKSTQPNAGGSSEGPEQPTAGSQRRKICMQMADVIRRAGSGLERGLRWKSGTAPGTKDLTESLLLKGNSANAELAAGECVKTVRI